MHRVRRSGPGALRCIRVPTGRRSVGASAVEPAGRAMKRRDFHRDGACGANGGLGAPCPDRRPLVGRAVATASDHASAAAAAGRLKVVGQGKANQGRRWRRKRHHGGNRVFSWPCRPAQGRWPRRTGGLSGLGCDAVRRVRSDGPGALRCVPRARFLIWACHVII